MFVLVYKNKGDNAKRFIAKRYHLPKDIIKISNVIISEKNLYDQAIDSGLKWYKEIKKLITWQEEDYASGYLSDYGYIKNHYRLIAVALSRLKELDTDPKTNHQIEFVRQLKKLDDDGNGTDTVNDQTMFVLAAVSWKLGHHHSRAFSESI